MYYLFLVLGIVSTIEWLTRISVGHDTLHAVLGIDDLLIGGGLSLLGGAINSAGQASANASNVDIAKRQMEFQQNMSNTAYQRASQDMKAAGLNPMLAFSQGGASTPGGASIAQQNPNQYDMGGAVNNALNVATAKQQLRRQDAEIDNINTNIENTQMDTTLKDSQNELTQIQQANAKIQGEKAGYEARAIKAELPQAENRAQAEAAGGKVFGWTDALGSRLGAILGYGNSAKALQKGGGPSMGPGFPGTSNTVGPRGKGMSPGAFRDMVRAEQRTKNANSPSQWRTEMWE